MQTRYSGMFVIAVPACAVRSWWAAVRTGQSNGMRKRSRRNLRSQAHPSHCRRLHDKLQGWFVVSQRQERPERRHMCDGSSARTTSITRLLRDRRWRLAVGREAHIPSRNYAPARLHIAHARRARGGHCCRGLALALQRASGALACGWWYE